MIRETSSKKEKTGGNSHTMLLNFPHMQVHRQSQDDRLIEIKNQFTDLKSIIIKNIAENISDQCDESTYYYLLVWSRSRPQNFS